MNLFICRKVSLRVSTWIGLHGGNSMWELGSPRDMLVFFGCLDRLARPSLSEAGRFVLFDRLFKRYLRPEDLDEAVSAMTIARRCFQLTAVDDALLTRLGLDKNDTALRLEEADLAKMFQKYFDAIFHCIESYRLGKQMAGYFYNPVKVSRTDLPGFAEDKARDPKLYDELTGTPYWFST